ncbi:hypothetical protein C3L33_15363, partial [Rhododendron williamsianum]
MSTATTPPPLHLLLHSLSLLTTPQPSHSLSYTHLQTIHSLALSLTTRIANLRASRGDLAGSDRARLIVRKLKSGLPFCFFQDFWHESRASYLIVAIKKIDYAALSLQEEDNFLEAVSNMSRLRHPNIIALVGFCGEHGQRLLVHDYVGNGNLHDMLHFADERSKQLTWNARVRVALGTARALEYLHEVCLPSVVHRNFKSANILLDEELNPHLSDCGLAALTPNTERQVSSTEMISFGYSAPEFALSGIYTVKSDVYSFGVVMLELLTGRKPLDSSRVRAEQSLVRWATPQLHDIDALAKMVDPALNGMYPAKSLSRFADILALCVQPEPEFRPPMSEVVQALVRLMQRASVVKRHSSEESGFMFKTPDHETADISY